MKIFVKSTLIFKEQIQQQKKKFYHQGYNTQRSFFPLKIFLLSDASFSFLISFPELKMEHGFVVDS